MNKSQEKSRKIIKLTMIVSVLFVIIVVIFYVKKRNVDSVETSNLPIENVVTYNNGDSIYRPSIEDLAYDEKEYMIYYDNLLMVYLFPDVDTVSISDTLLETVEGTVVGNISGSINVVQILVKDTDLAGLNKYASDLMQLDAVIYATYEYPLIMQDSFVDNNPWSENNEPILDKGNEDVPNGNDWWAEAIGAYTAWEIVDKLELSKVKVGVIDSGFDMHHEDLSERLSVLEGYEKNTEDDHGTAVAGIISAQNNNVGLRGVADSADLTCVDWSPVTNDKNSDNYYNLLSTGEYIEIIKQMIEEGNKVINNSWGNYFLSKSGFTQALYGEDSSLKFLLEYFAVHTTGAYESYVNYVETYSKRTALDCTAMIIQILLSNDCEDFIIVQAAGNGYDNSGPGVDAKYSGTFCSISEDVYNVINFSTRERLLQRGVDYEKIDNHIIIVGAVENILDEKGNYHMARFSNYGNNVDICAPGTAIFTTKTHDSGNYVKSEDIPNSGGTSYAAPMVSGTVALLWQINPNLSAAEIKQILFNSATGAIGVNDDFGSEYLMLNVGAAVKSVTKGDETTEMYRLFYDKLLEVQREYGESTIYHLDEYTSYLTGLCFARLLDFDADGQEELILAYSYKAENSYISRYHIEVWKYNNFNISKVFDGEGFGTDGGVTTLYITQVEDCYYLIEGGKDSFKYSYIWGLQDDKFTQMNTLISEETGNYFIDGIEVTEEEYNVEHDKWWENITTYDLWYVDNDALVTQELERTLATLRAYLGIVGNELAKEDNSVDKEKRLREIVSKNVMEPLQNFIFDDFDNNGKYEAIAFCGEYFDEDGSYFGTLYFVTEKGIEVIREKDGYWNSGIVYDFGNTKVISITEYFTTGGITYYYQVNEDKVMEIEGSGYGNGLYQDEQGRMCMTDSQYDACVDGTGHTWNVYYFYWDNGLREYGGTQISVEDFSAYNGSEDILQKIVEDGFDITSIFKRENGIININCCDGWSNCNIRITLADKRVELAPITEGSYYEEGIIKKALIPDIATY